jgi:hypothetical protein
MPGLGGQFFFRNTCHFGRTYIRRLIVGLFSFLRPFNNAVEGQNSFEEYATS